MNFVCDIKSELPTVKGVTFRPLEINDFKKGFIDVQHEFRECKMNEEQFIELFNEMKKDGKYNIIVAEDNETHEVVLSGTILIEKKFIHNGGIVGHIEDIMVKSTRRKDGLGKVLIQSLITIGKEKGCYKIILDCSDDVKPFYEKCGLYHKDNCMVIRFD